MSLIKLDLEKVEEVFRNSTHQGEVLEKLYRMVFPDWDRIERLEGWPVVNRGTWKHIAKLFMEFDKKHHPEVLPGGLWLNKGFSWDDEVPAGYVDLERCKIIYKEKEVGKGE